MHCSMMWPCVSALPKRLVVLVPSMYQLQIQAGDQEKFWHGFVSISCVNQSHETNFRMVILKVLALGAVDGFGAGCTWAAWVRKICHAWIGKSPVLHRHFCWIHY